MTEREHLRSWHCRQRPSKEDEAAFEQIQPIERANIVHPDGPFDFMARVSSRLCLDAPCAIDQVSSKSRQMLNYSQAVIYRAPSLR